MRVAQVIMASDDNSFFGLKVPEGNDRRELYKSQYRAIYTCAPRSHPHSAAVRLDTVPVVACCGLPVALTIRVRVCDLLPSQTR